MTAKPTGPAVLTWSGVTARRMARYPLAEPADGVSLAGVAGVLCGVHAQVAQRREGGPRQRACARKRLSSMGHRPP